MSSNRPTQPGSQPSIFRLSDSTESKSRCSSDRSPGGSSLVTSVMISNAITRSPTQNISPKFQPASPPSEKHPYSMQSQEFTRVVSSQILSEKLLFPAQTRGASFARQRQRVQTELEAIEDYDLPPLNIVVSSCENLRSCIKTQLSTSSSSSSDTQGTLTPLESCSVDSTLTPHVLGESYETHDTHPFNKMFNTPNNESQIRQLSLDETMWQKRTEPPPHALGGPRDCQENYPILWIE
eukprot:GHVO01041164.1.p2 GENE.GHVO01041164.1~~GHVO01041164.1.p2  ORF type:complete len:238 (-),score=16.22 GHVO01041164.1:1433-2146(-)